MELLQESQYIFRLKIFQTVEKKLKDFYVKFPPMSAEGLVSKLLKTPPSCWVESARLKCGKCNIHHVIGLKFTISLHLSPSIIILAVCRTQFIYQYLVNGLARQGSLPLWKSDSFFVLCLRHDKPFSGPCVDSMRRMDNCCSLRHLLPMQTTTRTCRYRYRQESVLIGSEPAVIPIEDASDIKLIAVFLYSMYFLEKFCFLLYCYFPYLTLFCHYCFSFNW